MKHKFIILFAVVVLLVGCNSKPDVFLVQQHNIGMLTDSTQVKHIESIFENDSVVRFIAGDEFTGAINSIEIYEKGGKKLLDLSPQEALDSTSVISSVRIIDERYKTEKGISALSTFKDIKEAYKISKIDNLINSVVISVNEIEASFTIDKKELPASLQFDMNAKINALQIPDKAKIKYFILHW